MKTIADIKKIGLSLNGLVVFEEILKDQGIHSFCKLLAALTPKKIDCEEIYITYHAYYKAMVGKNWRQYLVQKIFDCENAFVLLASGLEKELNADILENISRDFKILQALAEIEPQEIIDLIAQRFQDQITDDEQDVFTDSLWPENWPVWNWNLEQVDIAHDQMVDASASQWLTITKALSLSNFIHQERWAENVTQLMAYYRQVGYGIFGTYGAFKLQETQRKLEGIENPDPIQIRDLICQEREQKLVLHNTESFLQGYPANNIILYGNRGTGKSSLVKALLNEYVGKGLRLVQLKKNQIGMFPELVGELSKIPLKFIIFIDDLSFNDLEEDYKNLKSLLEGGVESRPINVLVYATSNRRHLIKESFADRKGDDVHTHDNMEEKLSLADRFGITVTFLSPDQETYLKIVEGLAHQNKIDMDRDELRRRALKWVMMHNGRSGRTARQFVDHLIGEIAREKASV